LGLKNIAKKKGEEKEISLIYETIVDNGEENIFKQEKNKIVNDSLDFEVGFAGVLPMQISEEDFTASLEEESVGSNSSFISMVVRDSYKDNLKEVTEGGFVINDEIDKEEAKGIAKIGLTLLLFSGLIGAVGTLLALIGVGDIFLYAAGVLLGVGVLFLLVALFYYLSPKVVKRRKANKDNYEKLSENKKIEVNEKKEKQVRVLSNIFTWATALFPLFMIPAIIFNLLVIKRNKNLQNKKRKNKAIWRLVALPFLAFIGLIVILSILESLGIITSVAA
jgi:hypothetical protein